MAAAPDKSKSYFPLAGAANDGWSTEDEATATCYCGAVQLAFPLRAPGLVTTFVCNCTDCRKITASMFATNFVVTSASLRHLRGGPNNTQPQLKTYGQSSTIASGHRMTNYFCATCGTLMYRVGAGFPGQHILRVGTVDDFSLHETVLRPRVEQFVKDRVGWFMGAEGVGRVEGGSAFVSRL
ncbi:Mss4-like protein [Hypoxylon fragiforme]|uniref:Mss4-like protein n=1 Tax=Hypoxylon fragiforme TaxID=63214 RepID=UPI0020C6F75D|nr:Mss4-like protein [Hypoxylon fragiforme]KAI2609619.1 Mss4-like protein [Hypoxylon fragiforme]